MLLWISPRFKKIVPFLFYFIFLPLPVLAQQARYEKLSLRTAEPIITDGQLNEEIWAEAPEAGTLLQLTPYRQEPGKIRTSVKILYDDSHVYFGFLCYDTEPENILAGSSYGRCWSMDHTRVYASI